MGIGCCLLVLYIIACLDLFGALLRGTGWSQGMVFVLMLNYFLLVYQMFS